MSHLKQDVLHVRDAVSKTITVAGSMITITSDLIGDELIVSNDHAAEIESMFEYAYNRADEFSESENGVMLSISGGQHFTKIGDPVQKIYAELVK